nr:MAG TPA: hypothetical protein [Caudoviricetes sp.]
MGSTAHTTNAPGSIPGGRSGLGWNVQSSAGRLLDG